MKIAIHGAGVAGTTLAYWLLRAGHEPVLIEEAPELRTGGYVVDFWGLGFQLVEKMGLLSQVLDQGYTQRELRFVDERLNKIGGFSTEAMGDLSGGRFTTIRRGALVEMIYGALEGEVETVFGDSIARVVERGDGLSLTLRGGTVRDFDILIGTDGLHSATRHLCFDPHPTGYETYLGYMVGAIEVEGYERRDEGIYVVHPTPSHQIARFALRNDKTMFLLVFRNELGDIPTTRTEIEEVLRTEFGAIGGEAPAILEAMARADSLYFDRMSQIRMPSWTKGRVALAGDAAAAVTLIAGEGTGLAVLEAYVLAGELGKAQEDYQRAFAEYESHLRGFLADKQKSAEKFASSFVPRTELGIWARNQATKLMHIPGVANLLLGSQVKDDFDLPDYKAVFGGR